MKAIGYSCPTLIKCRKYVPITTEKFSVFYRMTILMNCKQLTWLQYVKKH